MRIVGYLVAVLLLFAAGASALAIGLYSWEIAAAVVQGAKQLEPSVYVPLTVTVLTATLGLAATLYTQTRTRRSEIEAAFRERKIEIYLDFLETIEHLILSAKPELETPSLEQNELVKKLIKVRTKAVLWGSTGVLKSLNDFSKVKSSDPIKMFRVIEALQRAMRKDLGLSNFGLEQDFFSKLILLDPEEFERLKNGHVDKD